TAPTGLFGHISSNSLFWVRSPRWATLNLPKVMMLPTDCAFSVVSTGCWTKLAQDGFGAPPPASGVLSTCPSADTMRQSRPATGLVSPGFATVCLALPYIDG